MSSKHQRLLDLLRDELDRPLAPPVREVARAAAERFRGAEVAVLFYGSCLRDGIVEGRVVDLYILVDNYKSAYDSRLEALANQLLPPNVYRLAINLGGEEVQAKVAVLSLQDFLTGVSGQWFHPYLWARFAQPCALISCRDDAVRRSLLEALAAAPKKLLGEVAPLLAPGAAAAEVWVQAFQETYRCELRSEQAARAAELFQADSERYSAVFQLLELPTAAASPRPDELRRRWWQRRALGKLLSVLRLIKAAYTFRDGAQYLLWKIERHSGAKLELTAWQKRHPILASPWLAWRLWRLGGFR